MKRLTVFSIRIYQFVHPSIEQFLVSIFGFSSKCHQTPTCSEYTISQIEKHGTIQGLKKGLTRVLHCSQLSY